MQGDRLPGLMVASVPWPLRYRRGALTFAFSLPTPSDIS